MGDPKPAQRGRQAQQTGVVLAALEPGQRREEIRAIGFQPNQIPLPLRHHDR